ncbi:hypothetical protein GCM10009797_32690 [Nocardioides hwasunensis]
MQPRVRGRVEPFWRVDRLEQPERDVLAHVRRQGHPRLVQLRLAQRHKDRLLRALRRPQKIGSALVSMRKSDA